VRRVKGEGWGAAAPGGADGSFPRRCEMSNIANRFTVLATHTR
jgi:hypothetical protein